MILHIDTKDQKVIKVSLKEGGKVVGELSEDNEYGSQVLLPLIIKLLEHANSKKPYVSSYSYLRGRIGKMINAIKVETGPGSFTGLRVGVSVANALGFSLGIHINGKKMETNLIY